MHLIVTQKSHGSHINMYIMNKKMAFLSILIIGFFLTLKKIFGDFKKDFLWTFSPSPTKEHCLCEASEMSFTNRKEGP